MSSQVLPSNYMEMVMQALIVGQQGDQNQQIADTITTQGLANIESSLNSYWNDPNVVFNNFLKITEGVLTYYAQVVQSLANSTNSGQITAAQTAYQAASAQANASTSNVDALVQSSQGQSQQDSSNIQNLLTIVQSAMQLMSFTASLLSK